MMHDPLNIKSVSCLVTSGRTYFWEKKKRETSSCLCQKKVFPFYVEWILLPWKLFPVCWCSETKMYVRLSSNWRLV